MKCLKFLILYLGCAMGIYAQVGSDKTGVQMDAGADKYHADLQFTTPLIEQRYCTDGTMEFKLQAIFKNGGGQTIILDKRSSIVPKYAISRSSAQAAMGKYERVVHTLVGVDGELMTLDPIPDQSQFVTLKVGDSYHHDESLRIRFQGKELRGTYFLQLTILTWHYPMASNIEWREKWRSRGYLWTNSITSQPVPFTVVEKPVLVDCSR